MGTFYFLTPNALPILKKHIGYLIQHILIHIRQNQPSAEKFNLAVRAERLDLFLCLQNIYYSSILVRPAPLSSRCTCISQPSSSSYTILESGRIGTIPHINLFRYISQLFILSSRFWIQKKGHLFGIGTDEKKKASKPGSRSGISMILSQ